MANLQRRREDDEHAAAPPPGVSTPALTLPKGGGAIRGIGEKFAANPVTGTGSMSVPIATSPGRSGFGPQLSLSYDSGAGNGPFGFGWSLSLPSVTRKTDKGLPKYCDAVDSDVFIVSGAEDLVPVLVHDASGKWVREELPPRTVNGRIFRIRRYRPRIEGLFAHIERWTNTTDATDVFWRSITHDNITAWYGKTADSRIADPADPRRIFSWLICQSHDDKGNVVVYGYKAEDSAKVFEDSARTNLPKAHERNRTHQSRSAQRYLKRIRYGNRSPYFPELKADAAWPEPPDAGAPDGSDAWHFEVVFDYGEHDAKAPAPHDAEHWPSRPDPFSSCRAGFEVRTYRLCQRVLMFHHFPGEVGVERNCLVRSTDFTYPNEVNPTDALNPVYTFLEAVAQTGYRRDNGSYDSRSLPPVQFEYSKPTVQETVEEVDPSSLENLPIGVNGSAYRWTDLHGEGIPGILTEQADAWFYKRNLSPLTSTAAFAPLENIALKPNVALSSGADIMDLAGDGQPDVVVIDCPVPGLYEHDDAEGWQPFRPFTSRLNLDLRDPNLKFVDLDGDGRADVLITEDDAFVWHASLADEGFGPARRVALELDEERGPRIVFSDGTQSIYLADLSGDGLTDICRIRNGEACYWPNLGYGHFGAKVTMDNAPWFDNPDQFDHARIHLADIDGSGTTDIIYLHRDGVRLYFNQSGNGWSQPHTLKVFPRIDDLASIVPTDLLGNGTACLVWSSPLPGDARRPMRYVNLMGGIKAHLLVKTVNNLGTETRVTYAPSTKFYLQDKRDGKPWITRLPFPVHVVERVETYDHISRNHFATRYAYHHGYFDGEEREFRGFGMVEQWDTEQFAAVADGSVLADNVAAASHVPPVHTKTWFHTGVYLGWERLSRHFESEYFREPGLTVEAARPLLLDDSTVPADLTPDEAREACRALKGSMLRQEVYADDADHPGATPQQIRRARTPYTVTEQNFTIRALQKRGANLHAVFFSHVNEALSYHYERNPADPRIQHALTLEVDDFGNVLKQAAIGYGRRLSPLWTQWDRDRQTTALLTYTENRVTNAIGSSDAHRNPLSCESITFELTGYTATGPAGRYRASDFVEPDPAAPGRLRHKFTAPEVGYEATAAGSQRRRPIEARRTLYRRDDLSGLLPLGELQPRALPGESYKLAFTDGLLDQVFQRPRQGQADEPLLPDPEAVLGGQAGNRGGYLRSQILKADGRFPASDADDHWWVPSGQAFYSANPADSASTELAEARDHFFLSRRYRDPFGQHAFVDFDARDLLMTETRDALGNRVTVYANDYRVLQPRLVSDPNWNRTEVAFDTLGMVVGTAVMGKPAPAPVEGDTLAGFVANLTQAQLDGFFDADDPHAAAVGLLKDATTRVVYDLDRFRRTRQANPNNPDKWQPACAATLARETHASAPLPPQGLKIQLSFSYSDGFGREIQKKIQAEPGPVPQRDATGRIVIGADGQPVTTPHDVSPRWAGSGWTVFNNKGKPVRQFEPFFTDTHRFEFEVSIGVSPVLFYDPAERVIATLHPNHTYEKVVFDPWQQTTYDVNDTCAPRNVQTGDPRTDADISGYVAEYFRTQPATWQTWRAQRIGGAMGMDERNAALRAEAHADTPATAHFDVLGRPFLTVARNRVVCPGHDLDGSEESFATRVELDIEGNRRAVRDAIQQAGDALGRIVMRYAYDVLGNRIHQLSMEAGARWMLNDVAGKPIRAWDSRGHGFTTRHDALRRPTEHTVRGTTSESDPRTLNLDILVEKIEYGETLPNAEVLNLRTRIYRHSDSAGVAINARLDVNGNPTKAFDFKGNLLRSTRQLVSDYIAIPNWRLDPKLDDECFEGSTCYDALDRPVQSIPPHSSQGRGQFNVIQPVFNEANLLERVDVWLERAAEPVELLDTASEAPSPVGVANIDYDAKGQRLRIDYKNGTRTFYRYDPLTFRLDQLLTKRKAADFPGDDPRPPVAGWPGKQVQNLHYTYDPAGNITHIQDDAQQTIYFRNKRVEPSNDYVYDALYRLIQATGREHLGRGGAPIAHSHNDAGRVGLASADAAGRFAPNDGNAMGTYIERYVYDAVGNFLQMQHRGGGPANAGWTRTYDYLDPSLIEDGNGGALLKAGNRLTRTTLNPAGNTPQPESYMHDAHGNMLRMPHLGGGLPGPNMHWDYKDQLRQANLGGGGTAYYVHDASGQRVRKVWEKAPGLTEERIYLGGFEIFRRHGGAIGTNTAALERTTLHVMDDKQRIALVETRTLDTAGDDQAPRQLTRYQFGNHLGSSYVELDEQAQIISYEEYAPYGSSTYQAVRNQTETAKRYRYTGKERDEESGLYYHGARYYAPWLGRWTACDPAGEEEGLNLYQYCFDNPTGFVDPDGQSGKKLAIVIHNESKPAGKELAKPKEPVKPQKAKIKDPGKNASDKEKAKYEKDKSKADKEFSEGMKTYEAAKRKYDSDLKEYKANEKAWSAYHKSQNEFSASEKALKAEGYDVVKVDSGKALLEALQNAGTIKELVILHHGTPWGPGGEGPGSGLYTDKPPPGATFDAKRGAKLSDLEKMINDKKIVFDEAATIVLAGCRTAGGKEGTHVGQSTWTGPIEDTFAYRLAKITGLEVFGSEGVSSYGTDQRKSTPWRHSDIAWHRFTQQGNSIKTESLKGKYLNVVKRKTSAKPD
ncbi:toxin [Burkholderia sp. Bp9031]|uniref:SpvB/TcaC N-terminal domain-containing protein n=1 Tax=Burkholderia sp. Bp9031 TaxID=2184566 RepID=UPI000F5E8058|nr:SpvB/TcaC N-terminal domain-containing protein [Burkholderia sp. Bp9031]RQZ06079.1 toxin [Burkholderia sp. Bp9031]